MELNVNQEVTLRQQLLRYALITTLAGGLFSLLLVGVFNLTSTPDSVAGTNSSDQECFTISDSENKIYKFRLSDGTILASKSLSSASDVEAATLNLEGDTLWMLNSDELHYSLTSGTMANTKVSGSNISAQQLSGSIGNVYISDFDAMSVDANGDLWAGSSDNSPLLIVVIDRSTGNVKEDYFGSGKDYLKIDNSSYSALRFDAMAFDPVTNELYANMNGSSMNYDYLFNINTSNGAMTLIRQFNTIDDVEGMGFDEQGDLFVTTGSNASSSSLTNRLWKVDLINGEVTLMYSLWGGDMETCDCVMGDPITTNEISGNVFYDQDEDTVLSSGDVGTHDVTVYLYNDNNANQSYDSGTDDLVDSTTTYSDGYYQFRLNYTSGTENYVLWIDTNDLPDNSYLTTNNIEIATFTTGRSIDENNDFGYATDSSQYWNIITGTVYGDADEDQVLDQNENGVSGVKVLLYSDENCDGVVNGSDALLESSIVGPDGKYSFIREYDTSSSSGGTSGSITEQVGYSYDDAEEDGGSMTRTSSDLDFGEDWVGVRFRSVDLPQGATITSAYLEFTADADDNVSTSLRIYGEDEDDADEFSSSNYDITDRDRTSAYVDWSPSTWTKYSEYNTPELKTVVQEIANRSGWSSGNDMVFIIKPVSGERDAYSYNGSSSKAPKLYINYTTSGGGGGSSTNDCYITKIDESTKPSGSSLTTDNVETAQFTSGGNTDSMNNFGLWGGALPVTWLHFDGAYLGEAIQLSWSTGSEENNSHFEVERSVDGTEWEVLVNVTGAGTSTEINSYETIDESPNPNINYYRIKQVDFDGQYDYSRTIVLSKAMARNSDLTLFPNPARDYITVRWTKEQRNGEIELTDINGRVLKSVSATNQGNMQRFDLSNYDQGVYFIRFSANDVTTSKKFVIYK